MMRVVLISLLLCFGTSLFAQDRISMKPGSEVPFKAGEVLNFDIHFGIIRGGRASLSVTEEELYGQPVYHSSIMGETTGFVAALYKIKDVYESWFRKSDNLPLKAVRDIREGSYRYYDLSTFDQEANLVMSQKGGLMSMPQGILDMASVLYYMRRLPLKTLKEGDILYFDTFFAHELFPFYVVYKGREVVNTRFGRLSCMKFVPVVEPGRVFNKEDDMNMWFTADENVIPVLVKFNAKVGTFSCELSGFENLKYPLTVAQ